MGRIDRHSGRDWEGYYAVAAVKRRKLGGDPWEAYRKRQEAAEKRWLTFAGVVMSLTLLLYYFVLIR